MSNLKTGKKRSLKKDGQTSNFYFALKSQNEIYFQMASIFKAASYNKDEMAKKIIKGFLIGKPANISLEKPV